MRNIILSIIGLLLLAAAFFGGNILLEKSERAKPKYKKTITAVFTKIVENKEIPIILTASGNLSAKNKIALFSEVQGVLKFSDKAFKPGTKYTSKETLLRINNEEFLANLKSQKSRFFSLITSILPDIRLDYPLEFEKWNAYLKDFDVHNVTSKLPTFSSDKEKYFVSGRGVLTSYYNIKNLEVRFAKHELKAPFSGVLTEALVSPGTLVRVGQKLGEYMDPSIYEMEVAINSEFADLLKVGTAVALFKLGGIKKYSGKLVRINGKVDQASQTIKVYIDVKHPDLKEGMFLAANLVVKSEANAIQVSRKLLVDNKAVYTVKNDSILSLSIINPVYFGIKNVVIKGLRNNDVILTQTLPGAFEGMIVKINTKK